MSIIFNKHKSIGFIFLFSFALFLSTNTSNAVMSLVKSSNHFHNGVAIVEVNNKYGLIDKKGNYIIEPLYQKFGSSCPNKGCSDLIFNEKAVILKKDNLNGLIDINGNVIVDFTYAPIKYNGDGIGWTVTSTNLNDDDTYVDTNGKIVSYETFKKSYDNKERLIRVKKDSLTGVINDKDEVSTEPYFDYIRDFKEGFAIVEKDNMYGVINDKGEVVVEPYFDHINDYNNGMAIVKKDDRYGAINDKGEIRIEPLYTSLNDFSDGLALAKSSEEGYIYIDSNGKTILKNIQRTPFYSPYDFHDGLAEVVIDTDDSVKVGYMNKKGEVVIEPTFSIGFAGGYYSEHNTTKLIIYSLLDNVFFIIITILLIITLLFCTFYYIIRPGFNISFKEN